MKAPGLIRPEDRSFAEIIRPLAAEVAPCYWAVCHQSGGPFDSHLAINNPRIEEKRLDVAACHYTDISCWRPFTFPLLAAHVRLDEWTQFAAIRGDEARLRELAASSKKQDFAQFFGVEQPADLLLLYVHGWWEAYSPHFEWRKKVRIAFPQSYERSWRKRGEPPDSLIKRG
jgi:hypothetical protein